MFCVFSASGTLHEILGFYARNNFRNCMFFFLSCNTADNLDRNGNGTLIIVSEVIAGFS